MPQGNLETSGVGSSASQKAFSSPDAAKVTTPQNCMNAAMQALAELSLA